MNKLSFLLLLFISLSYSQVDGSVKATTNYSEDIILGILPVKVKPKSIAVSFDVTKIIKFDLNYNGNFKLEDLADAKEEARKALTKKGGLAYIELEYQNIRQGDFILQAYIKDTKTKKIIYEKKYRSKFKNKTENRIRLLIHLFSNEVVKQLLGEDGFATSKVVFSCRDKKEEKHIYLMDYNGFSLEKISDANSKLNVLPSWMKDNRYVLYTSYINSGSKLYLYDRHKKRTRSYFKADFFTLNPDYNPIDDDIVFMASVKGNMEIFRSYWKERKPIRISYISSIESSPNWSPSGNEIVFTSNRSGNPHLYVMDREGFNVRRITYEGKYNSSPAWSPVSSEVAFVRLDDNNNLNIWTVDVSSLEEKQLTYYGKNESPSWSKNGKAIVFSSKYYGKENIFIMKSNGEDRLRLTWVNRCYSPRWEN